MTIDEVYARLLVIIREVGVPYCFIGALGAIAWGRPRSTTDLDLVVIAGDRFASLEAALLSEGFSRGGGVGPAEPGDVLPDIAMFWSPNGKEVRVDVFIAKVPFEREVVQTAITRHLFGADVPVARVEAMLVYKLLAERPKDLIDVDSIMETRLTTAQPIDWPLVTRWATDWGIEDRVESLRARFPSA